MQVVVDSLLTNYHKTGTGKTLLLVHGWADSLDTFSDLRQKLAKNYSVISLDLPGFGQTQPPPNVWDLTNYAQFIARFLKKTKTAKPYAIVAHSNGGAVVIHGLARGELDADKLVLLGSSGIRDRQALTKLLLKIVAKTGKVLTLWLPQKYRKKLQKKLYGTAGSDMLVVPHLQETFKKTVKQDVQTDARELNIPTLLIYGDKDRATPSHYGEIFQNLISGSKLEIIPGAGHFTHHEETEQVKQKIERFLQ